MSEYSELVLKSEDRKFYFVGGSLLWAFFPPGGVYFPDMSISHTFLLIILTGITFHLHCGDIIKRILMQEKLPLHLLKC